MASTSPEAQFELAKAHAATHALASRPSSEISRGQREMLAASRWPDHRIDAGWLCVREALAEKTGHAHLDEARSIWHSVAEDFHALPSERLKAVSLLTFSREWRKVGCSTQRTTTREVSRLRQRITGLHTTSLEMLKIAPGRDQKNIIGTMAELVICDLLIRTNPLTRHSEVIVPAESWYDHNAGNPAAAFDLWRFVRSRKQKIQVKSHDKGAERHVAYDPDIAVVVLGHHWLGQEVPTIVKHLVQSNEDDDLIIGAANSVRTFLDSHFRRLVTQH